MQEQVMDQKRDLAQEQKLEIVTLARDRVNRIFRKNDIRGKVQGELDGVIFYSIGRVIGKALAQDGAFIPTLVIGSDCRPESQRLEAILMQGARSISSPIFVSLGQATTPIVQTVARDASVSIALMVTASHNSAEYNGLKIYGGGLPITGEALAKFKMAVIEEYAAILEANQPLAKEEITCHVMGDRALQLYLGRLNCLEALTECPSRIIFRTFFSPKYERVYTTFLENYLRMKNFRFFVNKDKAPVKVYNPVDASLAGPITEEIKNRAEQDTIGVIFDGDGDRALLIDESGKPIEASTLACIVAKFYASTHEWAGKAVVFEQTVPPQVASFIQSLGYKVIICATGQASIVKAVSENKAIFAFEESGHITFFDKGPALDDGFFAALRIIEIMTKTAKTLLGLIDELNSDVKTIFKAAKNLHANASLSIDKDVLTLAREVDPSESFSCQDIDGKRICFQDGRMILVRRSNTEDVLRILVTGPKDQDVKTLAQSLEKALEKNINNLEQTTGQDALKDA